KIGSRSDAGQRFEDRGIALRELGQGRIALLRHACGKRMLRAVGGLLLLRRLRLVGGLRGVLLGPIGRRVRATGLRSRCRPASEFRRRAAGALPPVEEAGGDRDRDDRNQPPGGTASRVLGSARRHRISLGDGPKAYIRRDPGTTCAVSRSAAGGLK